MLHTVVDTMEFHNQNFKQEPKTPMPKTYRLIL